MDIKELDLTRQINENKKLEKRFHQLEDLLDTLKIREVPESGISLINKQIRQLNNFRGSDKALKKEMRKAKNRILKFAVEDLKLAPKNYYRNQWMAIGMSVFGISMGAAFSAALDNFAFIGLGLPIGMAIGLAVGSSMDEKARKEGRQLDIDLEY